MVLSADAQKEVARLEADFNKKYGRRLSTSEEIRIVIAEVKKLYKSFSGYMDETPTNPFIEHEYYFLSDKLIDLKKLLITKLNEEITVLEAEIKRSKRWNT